MEFPVPLMHQGSGAGGLGLELMMACSACDNGKPLCISDLLRSCSEHKSRSCHTLNRKGARTGVAIGADTNTRRSLIWKQAASIARLGMHRGTSKLNRLG